jgi:hypothetical protein
MEEQDKIIKEFPHIKYFVSFVGARRLLARVP